ncbi:hypothetical protein FOZ60_007993 [Perkinsus olseni]|uniref:Uncharacterized protein n=2 Tax=Perkinsus olseni TaxID=32597 RepID=A0A7J6NMM7_PEROL|nr:hypothetical protein FOZ60_007993 [Perkinsus olseni]
MQTSAEFAIPSDPGDAVHSPAEHADEGTLRPDPCQDDGLPGDNRSELHQAHEPRKATIEVVEVDNEEASSQLPSTRAARGARRIAARISSLQKIAVVLVDKYNTAYRIALLLLLILLAFICGIQCYAQFIIAVPPSPDELDTLTPETLTNPKNTRYEIKVVAVIEAIILGSIGLMSLVRAAMVVKTLLMSDKDKLNFSKYRAKTVQESGERSDRTLKERMVNIFMALRGKFEMSGEWFWHGYFTLQILDILLQIIRLVELGGRSVTGEKILVADRTAIMTQATLIMLVLIVGPTTLILNNRVWACLFDVMAAFSFTAAYLIVSGHIAEPDTWPALYFTTFVSFLSSLVPAVLSLDNIVGIDRYLLEIAKNPALTRAPRRSSPGYYLIALTLWAVGIGGFVYVTITQLTADCEQYIPRFDDECLLPVHPILDSNSCDCRMASMYLQGECVQDDMARLSLYNRIEYLRISDRNPTASTTCTDQPQILLDTLSAMEELVVLSMVAVPIEELNLGTLDDLEVLAITATRLATIPDDVHQRLPSIRSFQFELSQIQQLPFDSLKEMRHLEYLGLAGNPICTSTNFPEWTEGIVDCGSESDDACVVESDLAGLAQTLAGYCQKWLSKGSPTQCLPVCRSTFATYSAMDLDGSRTMSIQENTALLQMFGLMPAGVAGTPAFHQCTMKACGKEPADEIPYSS